MINLLKVATNPHGVIIDAVSKILLKKFKLDKVLNYVEKPNELDEAVKKLRTELDELMGSKQLKKMKLEVDKSVNGEVDSDLDPINLEGTRRVRSLFRTLIKPIKEDMLKMIDKLDELDQKIINVAFRVKRLENESR
ncbi:MAG TPA: hypothetical protein DEO59_04310 [Balneola sp.]|jgi:hypothetical protein|nr:hypothetical protein [Balneola sp.]|tara:strand:- start:1560 stop:1970 length:411 start_codon:yes stop_codon:yes gene_type:complete